MLDMVCIATPEGLVEMARQRDVAEAAFLKELKDADRLAENLRDYQRHINSGAEPFGE